MPINLVSELTELRRGILTMGASVEQRVSRAISGLLEHNIEAARIVRTGDREIDAMEIDIESECLRVLALTQPVAGDLRFVLAVLRINNDLERVGDLAKSIAKRVLALEECPRVEIPRVVIDMAAAAKRMLGDALGALADGDAELSRSVRRSDQRVDDLQKEVFVWAHDEIRRHIEHTEAVLDLLSIARKLERIADIATNIAEDVIFIISGSVVRHQKA
jgi:phosphate transport system protein